MDFKRIKSIERKYYRVRINDGDLTRLAKIMANATVSEDKQIVIRIETTDGNEVFTCHDPEFFRSDDMPGEICSVSIKYSHYDERIDCRLSFMTGTSGSVKLSVEGSAPEVPGVFEDLEKVVKEKQILGQAFVRAANTYWYALIFSLLAAMFTFLVFDLWIDLWRDINPEFDGSYAYRTISGIGWGAILLTICLGPLSAEYFTNKILPPVQFTGRISDPDAKSRKRIIWVVYLIFLPLLVGVLASAAYEIIKLGLATN